jgi:hypothetical protein
VNIPHYGPGRAFADGDLAVDAAGNVYAADTFNGLVDFYPGSKKKWVFSDDNQGFVLKLTTAGAYNWVSTFRGLSSGFDLSRTLNLALDGSGGVFVGGSYIGSVDFDPGPGTATLPAAANFSGFVVKLSTNTGAFAWARALENVGSGSLTMVAALAADAAGNVYVTGSFRGTADFDPGAGTHSVTAAGSDAFVVKLTAGASFGWAETFGGPGTDGGTAITVDPSGTIHLAGSFSGTVDFDPDPLAFLGSRFGILANSATPRTASDAPPRGRAAERASRNPVFALETRFFDRLRNPV